MPNRRYRGTSWDVPTTKRKPRTKPSQGTSKLSNADLDQLIEEATVDAHDESEQVTGLYTMLEEHLEFPFQTRVLGVDVSVEGIDLTEAEQIVVVCLRDGARQKIGILDLPLPSPPPGGSEWIQAYRRWARHR